MTQPRNGYYDQPCPQCGVKLSGEGPPSVNIRNGKPVSYCWECGTEQHPIEAAPTTEMYLCETEFLVLHPDQLYLFRVEPDCQRCEELARAGRGGAPGEPTAPPALTFQLRDLISRNIGMVAANGSTSAIAAREIEAGVARLAEENRQGSIALAAAWQENRTLREALQEITRSKDGENYMRQIALAALRDAHVPKEKGATAESADMADVVREVLCRVFNTDAVHEFYEWYKPAEWIWWGRALGAFIYRKHHNMLQQQERRHIAERRKQDRRQPGGQQ